MNKLLFRVGLEKDELKYIEDDLKRIDQLNLKGLSMLTAGYMLVMFALSFFNSISEANRVHFVLCFCSCMGVLIFSAAGLFKTRTATLIGVYWYLGTIFSYGIAIGCTQESQTAVSFLIFIMVGPLVFFDSPIKLNAYIIFFDILFLVITMNVKTPAARETDMINGISYGLISCILNSLTMILKMNYVLIEKKMHTMAEMDSLTNVKNRNCFEMHYQEHVKQAAKNVTCIYIDVNGLHQMNNSQGHAAGDQMLKYFAGQAVDIFGQENVYRLGGDEYMVFCYDEECDIIKQKTEDLSNRMEEKNYSISIGIISAAVEGLDIDELINKADAEMYLAKKRYYEKKGCEQRSDCESGAFLG